MSARQDMGSLFQPLLLFAGFCKYLVIHSVMLQLSLMVQKLKYLAVHKLRAYLQLGLQLM